MQKSLGKNKDVFYGEGPSIVDRGKLKKMDAESMVGTYYYMAPEVVRGEKYNATADW